MFIVYRSGETQGESDTNTAVKSEAQARDRVRLELKFKSMWQRQQLGKKAGMM